MPTLADMKARIRGETDREDLDDAIVAEIRSAINSYRARRFFFNERRADIAFSTVEGVSEYGASANPNIANLVEIDGVFLGADGGIRELRSCDPMQMNVLLGSTSTNRSRPTTFARYGVSLRFYPCPDNAYSVTISGLVRLPAPATESEADNPWMNEAEELIRSRAKKGLYASWMGDAESAQMMSLMEQSALDDLLAETSRRASFSAFQGDYL